MSCHVFWLTLFCLSCCLCVASPVQVIFSCWDVVLGWVRKPFVKYLLVNRMDHDEIVCEYPWINCAQPCFISVWISLNLKIRIRIVVRFIGFVFTVVVHKQFIREEAFQGGSCSRFVGKQLTAFEVCTVVLFFLVLWCEGERSGVWLGKCGQGRCRVDKCSQLKCEMTWEGLVVTKTFF